MSSSGSPLPPAPTPQWEMSQASTPWQPQAWHAGVPKAVRRRKIPLAVSVVGVIVTLIIMAGIWAMISRVIRRQFPVDPFVIILGWLFVVPWTRTRSGYGYLPMAFLFWISYCTLGFLGEPSPIGRYALAQHLLKPGLCLIGLPWIALNAFSDKTLRGVLLVATGIAVFGALLSCLQMVYAEPFRRIVMVSGRGSGLWINPNLCGTMLMMMLFLILASRPLKVRGAQQLVVLILIAGVCSTLSRAAMVSSVFGACVYGLLSGKLKVILKVCVGAAVALVVLFLVLRFVATESVVLQDRVDRIERAITGEVEDIEDAGSGRLAFWQLSLEAIGSSWLTGLGHGRMERIVPIAAGLGPHNYFIYVLGNSGAIALAMLFMWLAWTLFMLLRVPDVEARAALVGGWSAFILLMMATHAILGQVCIGSVIALMVTTGSVYRTKESEDAMAAALGTEYIHPVQQAPPPPGMGRPAF